MPRINLLPWREALRKEREKNFGLAVLVTVAVAGALVYGGILFFDAKIAYQDARNLYLEQQITILDEQIKEIEELKQTKENLIARMQIIEELQASRPQIVHVFEELVLTLPNGVFLSSIEQKGDALTIKGVAESSARVSAFMRNINSSEWLADPELEVIAAQDDGRNRRSHFELKAKAVSPKSETDEEEGGDA